jgi:acetyl-CoA acetyltransferase
MGRLTDKYCIVGVGETGYSKNSGMTTRAMGAIAIRNAILDAGLTAADVNGVMSYHGGDSTVAPEIASDLGIRLDFYMDCSGGGSSTEALIGLAIGAIEGGMCETVAIFRLHASHDGIRHHQRTTGARQGSAQQARQQQPQSVLQKTLYG